MMGEGFRQKKVNIVLSDTPVKAALEASGKPDKCNRFFSDSQEKSRKT
jgi:hypothetical protein